MGMVDATVVGLVLEAATTVEVVVPRLFLLLPAETNAGVRIAVVVAVLLLLVVLLLVTDIFAVWELVVVVVVAVVGMVVLAVVVTLVVAVVVTLVVAAVVGVLVTVVLVVAGMAGGTSLADLTSGGSLEAPQVMTTPLMTITLPTCWISLNRAPALKGACTWTERSLFLARPISTSSNRATTSPFECRWLGACEPRNPAELPKSMTRSPLPCKTRLATPSPIGRNPQ